MGTVQYGEHTFLAEATSGEVTAEAFLCDKDVLVLRLTPEVILSENQLEMWLPDFAGLGWQVRMPPTVSMYETEITPPGQWTVEELKEYMQGRLPKLVTFLEGLRTGTYFA